MANITFHYLMVEDNAKREDTRKRMLDGAIQPGARGEHSACCKKILVLRDDIAHRLGYASYADYATEVRMVKNAATAINFLENLKTGLQPKFDAELEEFRQLKIKETGDPNAQINDLGLALFRQRTAEDEIQRGCRAVAGVFPIRSACWTACSRFISASSV